MQLTVNDLFKPFIKGPLAGKPKIIKFIDGYKNNNTFELNSGRKVKLIFEEETYKLLIGASKYPSKYQEELKKAQFLAAGGKKYYKITDFKKTLNYEGRPDAPPAGIQYELDMIKRLDTMLHDIMEKHGYVNGVPIICNGKVVGQAVSAVNVHGNPKADIALTDTKGKEVVWISYKNGTSTKDFQQWSGTTEISDFPQVQNFVSELKEKFPDGLKNGYCVGMKIRGDKSLLLKKRAIYGKDYGGAYGINNVNFVIQGKIDLKPVSKRGYTLVSSNAECYQNGENPKPSSDPILLAKYTSDRNQFGIPATRIMVYPYSGRTVNLWIGPS